MSKFTALTDELHDYLVSRGAREDAALTRVRRETAAMGEEVAVMQIAPDQGAFMTLLARLLGARRAVEIGTFTGYSAICIARGLSPDGLLIACEIDEERGRAAQENFALAGVAERIDLRVGPAIDTLAELLHEPDSYDLAFIDADKTGYDDYYESCLRLLRPGGLIVLDNVLLGGRVLDPETDDDSARAMATLNDKIEVDDRVEIAMIPVADGLTLARKR